MAEYKDENKAKERTTLLKARLNFDGYTLFPILMYFKFTEEGRKERKALDEKYGAELRQYVASVTKGGSRIKDSRPPIITGRRKDIEKLLTLILYMLEEYQGKKFGVQDLKIIKTKKEEESEEFNFIDYPFVSILDLHKNIITKTNFLNWRMEGILETITTRRLDRMPMVIISENPISYLFADSASFNMINMCSQEHITAYNKKVAEEEAQEEKKLELARATSPNNIPNEERYLNRGDDKKMKPIY